MKWVNNFVYCGISYEGSEAEAVTRSIRSSRQELFCKKNVPRNFTKFTGKHLYQCLFFNKVVHLRSATLLNLAQVFSCEFYEISKNTFSYRTPPVASSGVLEYLSSIHSWDSGHLMPFIPLFLFFSFGCCFYFFSM